MECKNEEVISASPAVIMERGYVLVTDCCCFDQAAFVRALEVCLDD